MNDLCYFEQCVYLACEDGVYTFDLNYKTLMKHTFPAQVGEVQRIVVNNSELFMMTNTVTKFELINKASALPTIPENEGSGGGGG